MSAPNENESVGGSAEGQVSQEYEAGGRASGAHRELASDPHGGTHPSAGRGLVVVSGGE